MSIFDDAGKILTGGKGKGGVPNPKDALNKIERIVEGGVKQINAATDGGLEKIKDAAQKEVGKVGTEVEKLVAEALAGLSNVALKPLFKQCAKEMREFQRTVRPLTKQEALRDDINKITFAFYFKVVAPSVYFYWSNVIERGEEIAKTLDRYGNSGIALKRSSIIKFIEDTGPSTMDFNAGVEAELFVGVKAGFGVWGIPTTIATRIADGAMKRLGVPK